MRRMRAGRARGTGGEGRAHRAWHESAAGCAGSPWSLASRRNWRPCAGDQGAADLHLLESGSRRRRALGSPWPRRPSRTDLEEAATASARRKNRWSVARSRCGCPGGRGGSGDLLADPNPLQVGAGEDDLRELPFLAVLLVLPDLEESAQANAVAFPIGGSQALPVDTAVPSGQGLGLVVPGFDRKRKGANLAARLSAQPVERVIDQGFFVDPTPLQAGAGEDDLRELPSLAVLLVLPDSEEPAQA